MQPVRAECISSKIMKNGIKLAKFQSTIKFKNRNIDLNYVFFNILTANQDLEVLWTIQSYNNNENDSYLDVFKLYSYNQNIFGNFQIFGNNFTETGIFDTMNGLPAQKHLYIKIDPREAFTIIMYIYYEDKRFEKAYLVTEDYDKFFKNQELCDITFVVGDEDIPAHKQIIIARNEVFSKIFTTNMLENETNRVKIEDITPKIFKLLLRFIYSGRLGTTSTDDLLQLVLAADKYAVKSLVAISVHQLSCNLSVDNAVQILMIADLVKVSFLKKKCTDLIVENKDKIVTTDGYKEIVNCGKIDLLPEIFHQTTRNSVIIYKCFFLIILSWVCFILSQRLFSYYNGYCDNNYYFFNGLLNKLLR